MASKFDQRGRKRRRELALAELAGRQHGVIALAQLRSFGLSPSGVRTRVAGGRLHRVHAGVYALGRLGLSKEGHWLAAVMACGPDALLSYQSAAALQGLRATAQTMIDVTVPRHSSRSRPGIRIHRPSCLTPLDRTSVDGIPCTSVGRTLLDLAAVLQRPALERACDQAEVLRVLDMHAVRELLARRAGHPGVRRLRDVLETGHVGENVPRTKLEEGFLRLCRRADLPLPEVNVWMAVTVEEMQVDFLWRQDRVIVEVDGFATHRTRQAFRRDRRRDQLLTSAGWRVIRFTWDQVTKEPTYVIEVMRKLVSAAPSPSLVEKRRP
jgi:very-short-patch-repair endonuclease/predicted transcriptional regulator of viral defense system